MNRYFTKMDMFNVLLVLNCVEYVFLQTCSELAVHKVAQVGYKLVEKKISCLPDVSLDQCAMECLLLKMCKSFDFQTTKKENGTICKLYLKTSIDSNPSSVGERLHSLHVDIWNWTTTVAGTCASRPCAENQRCLPTTPYRCIDIDCGIPPVLPVENEDTNMNPVLTTTTLGARAYYRCHDSSKKVVWRNSESKCAPGFNLCMSDSSWTLNKPVCE